MTLHLPEPFPVRITQLPKPSCHCKTLVSSPIPFPSRHAFRAKLRFRPNTAAFIKPLKLNIIPASTSSTPRSAQKEDAESLQLFEVHKMVDLSLFPDREAMWYLEVVEAYKLFYQPLLEE